MLCPSSFGSKVLNSAVTCCAKSFVISAEKCKEQRTNDNPSPKFEQNKRKKTKTSARAKKNMIEYLEFEGLLGRFMNTIDQFVFLLKPFLCRFDDRKRCRTQSVLSFLFDSFVVVFSPLQIEFQEEEEKMRRDEFSFEVNTSCFFLLEKQRRDICVCV